LRLEAAPCEVDERVEHELPGTVIRDLAAALGLEHGNPVRHARPVRPVGGEAERVDRRMLEEPELIGGARIAPRIEFAHRLERDVIGNPPQLDCTRTLEDSAHQSTMTT